MLTKDERKKIIQLLGMLGSDHDGEVLNAARLAHKLLGYHNLSWYELMNGSASTVRGDANLAAGGEEEGEKEFTRKDLEDAYHRGFRDGVKSRQEARLSWKRWAAYAVNEEQDNLSEWEYTFFSDFAQGRYNTPTEKQRVIFVRVAERLDLVLPESPLPDPELPF